MMDRYWKQLFRRLVLLGMGGSAFFPFTPCEDNENFNEFRQTVGPDVSSALQSIVGGDQTAQQEGLNSILDSLIQGLFAVVEPDGSTDE